MKKKFIIVLLSVITFLCISISISSCLINNTSNNDNNTKSAPVAGHFELRDIPLYYNGLIIAKYDYDFYLDGRVVTTIFAATQNGYSDVKKNYGNYIWHEGENLIYISWNDSSEVFDLLYTDEYVTNGIYKCYFTGANDNGEVAGRLVSAAYSTKTQLMYEITSNGGTVLNGSEVQYIKKGGDALTVTAVANDGFEFIGWSDGVAQAERTDKNLTANLSVTANFKQVKDIYKLIYNAMQGGTLEGELYQEVVDGKIASTVIAVPDEGNDEYGYEFLGWSDGVSEAERSDLPENNITVEARFARIGTNENPYKISTVEELFDMEKHPKAHYVLSNDIILDGSANFTPLFSEEKPFLGTFDGNGYCISNLKIYNETSNYTGLFAYIGHEYFLGDEWTGSVKNLTLNNVNISGNGYVGGIVGCLKGCIENCTVSGELNVLSKSTDIGGIAGNVIEVSDNETELINCFADVKIYNVNDCGSISAGGIAGVAFIENGTCLSCSAKVDINISASSARVGGVFGYVIGIFKNLSSSGNITVSGMSNDSSVGGVIGEINGLFVTKYHTVLEDCSSSCNVIMAGVNSGDYISSCGGIVGYMSNSSGYSIELVKNCNAIGNIDVKGRKVYAGGLIGYSKSDIEKCYSTGNINANGITVFAGGLAGIFNQSISIKACYSTGKVLATADVLYAGGIAGYHLGGEITSSYTVSEIKGTANINTLYAGGISGYTYSSITYNKTYWLYYSDSLYENAVGEINWSGIHTVNATMCANMDEFKNISSDLNDGLKVPAWEDTDTLPKLRID